MNTARIEQIRKRQQPTLFVPFEPVRVDVAGGSSFKVPAGLEWFKAVPDSVGLVLVEYTGEEIVWEIDRNLFHYAFTQPGHEFGNGDITVAVLRPQPLLISVNDFANSEWWSLNLDATKAAAMLARARLEVPLTHLATPAGRPYTRRSRS